jgi:hypothetical protein
MPMSMTQPARAAAFRPALATMLAAGVAAGLASTASAKVPGVLEHVPAETPLYIIVPDLGGLIGDLSAFHAAMADKLPPDAAQIGMGLFFAQSLATSPGVETNGSAAILLDFDADNLEAMAGGEPGMTLLLPIEDLEAFSKSPFMVGQGAAFDGDVLAATMPEGDTLYMRDIGSHTVAGPDAAAVRAFNAGEFGAAHESALAAAGARALGEAGIAAVANIPLLEGVIGEFVSQAEQQVNFLAMMGGGDAVLQSFTAMKAAAETVRRDGSVGLLSLGINAEGLAIDLGAVFRDGTPSAATFSNEGSTAPLVSALPQTDFLVAYAFDSSGEGMQSIVENAMAMMPMGEGGMGIGGLFEGSTGISGVIGASPAALGGAGLLAKQVSYSRAEDPQSAVGAMKEMISGMNGQSMMGMTYTTEYTEGGAEVNGAKVDTYAVRSAMDPNAMGGGMMMDPAMIQSMMYGMAGGPSGFVAKVDGGFYTTSSRNSELLQSAIDAGNGGDNLGGNEMLKKVSAKLQDSRFAEVYFSADQMFNSFGPFAQMLGMIDQFEPLPAMPPVGMSARGDGHGLISRFYLPADVLGFAAQFAQQMEQDDIGGGDDDPTEPDF